jgi:NADH-quinone oxidoreductase subunit B
VDSSGDSEVSEPVACPVTVTSSASAGLVEVIGGLCSLDSDYRNSCDRNKGATVPHLAPSVASGQLFHKSPPVSLVTERLVDRFQMFFSSFLFHPRRTVACFFVAPTQRNLSFCYMTEAHATAYDSKIEGNVIFTRFDAALNWVRKNSLWPMPMGLACCAIELMATAASRFDIARFGAEVMRFSPRQCDVMIVAGTVTYKMALAVKRIYEQMPEPKWLIAMGACASTGGMYRSYAVLQGIDQLLPVDVYISGCPPRPEALLAGLMKLQERISRERSLRNQNPELAEKLEEALA